MELGLFQLENLFQGFNRFLFFDLRRERKTLPAGVDVLLKKATALESTAVLGRLAGDKTPKDHPIVLVCENGVTSAQVARDLEGAGYQQIYVVAGGVDGLLSEV